MRYREILTEHMQLNAIIKVILKECKPFLSQVNTPTTDVLWRGMRGLPETGKMQARLTDRRPLDTDNQIHIGMNEWFTKHYEHPYRNAVFATGSRVIPGAYGSVYAIFPIGDFDFLWNKTIRDLYSDYTEIDDPSVQYAWANAFDVKYAGDPLTQTLSKDEKIDRINIGDVLDVHEQRTPYQTTDLSHAIKSRNEVMLWCSEYYYVARELLKML